MKAYETKIDQQIKNASMQGQSSPEASLYPPQANPGEYFARVFVPPTYATASERVLKRGASERLEIIPPTYEWVEEKVMIKAASSRLEQIPAKYERVEEKVLAKEAHVVWKKGRGPIEKVDNTTGEIMCLVEVPASYKTVQRTVLVNAPGTREVEIPAEYKTVKKRVMLDAPQERTITIPAEYEMVKVRKLVSPAQERRIPVAEEYQTVTKTVKTDDGYKAGPVDGILGRQTISALKSYQKDNRLAVGGLTYETVKKLGITL